MEMCECKQVVDINHYCGRAEKEIHHWINQINEYEHF